MIDYLTIMKKSSGREHIFYKFGVASAAQKMTKGTNWAWISSYDCKSMPFESE